MNIESLKALILRHADEIGANERPAPTGVDGLIIVRARRPTAFDHAIFDPVLCLILQGRKLMLSGDRELSIGSMETIVVSVGLPVISRVIEASPERPYLALALRLDPLLLSEMAEAAGAARQTVAPDCDLRNRIARADADQAILDAMGRLAALIGQAAPARAVLEPLVRREIHFWLAQSADGAVLRRIAEVGSRDHKIARAAARLRHEFAARLRAATLAREAGMSLSAFHAHFRAMTGTSPLQYQKSLRLIEARRLLRAGGHSVAAAAFAVGYESPTQFSREYARMFGTPPRATMHQDDGAMLA